MLEYRVLVNHRYIIIHNKNSRNGNSRTIANEFETILNDDGRDFFQVHSESKDHAIEMMQKGFNEGYNAVIAVGGDGTVHHVANFAINNQIPFGVVPAGSGNDFASAIGINSDLQRTYEVITSGKTSKLNVVETKTDSERYWTINITGAGLDAEVSKAAQERLKWLWGNWKYDLIAMWEILKDKPTTCNVSLDGETQELDIRMLVAGLGQTAGSGMIFLPDARYHHDTMQGGIITGDVNRIRLVGALQKVRKAQHVDLPYVHMFRAKEVMVETVDPSNPLMVQSEGEIRGYTKLSMKVVKEKLEAFTHSDFNFEDKSVNRGKY